MKKREVALARLTTAMVFIYGFEYVSEALIVQLTLLERCHLVVEKLEDEHTADTVWWTIMYYTVLNISVLYMFLIEATKIDMSAG